MASFTDKKKDWASSAITIAQKARALVDQIQELRSFYTDNGFNVDGANAFTNGELAATAELAHLTAALLETFHADINNVKLTNAEKTTRVPGIAFAEWGPGDMGFWLLGIPQPGQDQTNAPPMRAARARVLKATKDAKIFFLNSCNDKNVVEMIKEGVMICTGGYEVGRKFSARP